MHLCHSSKYFSYELLHTESIKHPSIHTCGCSQSQRFSNVPDSLDAAISDYRHTETPGVLWHLIDSCGLGSATCQHWMKKETEDVWIMWGNVYACRCCSSHLLVSSHIMTASSSLLPTLNPQYLQIHVGNWNKVLPISSLPANYSLIHITIMFLGTLI